MKKILILLFLNVNLTNPSISYSQRIESLNNLNQGKIKRKTKAYKLVILFHLHNLSLMPEFIKKINYFIKKNNKNDFYIKINVPIDKNINLNNIAKSKAIENLNIFKDIKKSTPYHSNLVNLNNYQKLYFIKRHLEKSLHITYNKLQIIFSENRGVDVGGFFLMLDQIVKEKLNLDFLVKLHTKTDTKWRNRLTSILNLKLDNLLDKYDYIYPCSLPFRWNDNRDNRATVFKQLLDQYNLPKMEFNFCAGTMFIISSKIIDFFKPYGFINIFNSMPLGYPKALPGTFYNKLVTNVHAYERLFGYLAKHLNLKTKIIIN